MSIQIDKSTYIMPNDKPAVLSRQLKYQIKGLEDRALMTLNRLETKVDRMNLHFVNINWTPSSTTVTHENMDEEERRTSIPHQQDEVSTNDMQEPSERIFSLPIQNELEGIDPEFVRTVYLGDKLFCFDKRELKPPPIYHFSKDIPQLFTEWENSRLLVIQGQGIPIKYWPVFYQKKAHINDNRRIWESIKVMWGNWKVRRAYLNADQVLILPMVNNNHSSSLTRRTGWDLRMCSGISTLMRTTRECRTKEY